MGNANIYIKNLTDSTANIYLYHMQPGSTPQCLVCRDVPPRATAPNYLPVSWDFSTPADYWGVRIDVSGGSRPGIYVTSLSGGDPAYYRESMLIGEFGDDDDGSSPTFTVDQDNFNIALVSNGGNDLVPMACAGPCLSPVTNVFVLMLENHSFDNILGMIGIAGVNPATGSNTYRSELYKVSTPGVDCMVSDPNHEFMDVVQQLTGSTSYQAPSYPTGINNSGFVANWAGPNDEETQSPPPLNYPDIMSGFTEVQLPFTFGFAAEYVVCQNWFSSLPGPTWPNRFFLHLGSSEGLFYSPSNEQMISWMGAGYNISPSIFDRMNAKGIPFAIYQDWNGPESGSFALVSALRGIDMGTTVTSLYQSGTYPLGYPGLAADLLSPYPYRYTFIEPNYGDTSANTYQGGSSQHPMDSAASGDRLIANVFGSILGSPIWQSSVLIITYDEHGGFYDHVPPPAAVAPGDPINPAINPTTPPFFNFEQLGVRVPAIVVSPLLNNKPAVDNTVYDHTSVLATLEKILNLEPLTARDAQANDLTHLWSRQTGGGSTASAPPVNLSAAGTPPKIEPNVPQRLPLTTDAAAARAVMLDKPLPKSGNLIGIIGIAMKTDIGLAETPAERDAIAARVKALVTRGDADAYIKDVQSRAMAAAAARRAAQNAAIQANLASQKKVRPPALP